MVMCIFIYHYSHVERETLLSKFIQYCMKITWVPVSQIFNVQFKFNDIAHLPSPYIHKQKKINSFFLSILKTESYIF